MPILVEPGKTRDPKPLVGEAQEVWLPPPGWPSTGLLSQEERRGHVCRAGCCSSGLGFEFCFQPQPAGVTLSGFSKIRSSSLCLLSLLSSPPSLPPSRIWV